MNTAQLIPVFSGSIQHETAQLVDARTLHQFLKVGKRFTTWINDRIAQYGFQQDLDFLPVLGESTGGRRTREYHLTLDMAKELSMVERNEQGRQARRYFIECEKRLQQIAPQDAETIASRHFQPPGTDRITITEEQHRAIADFINRIAGRMMYEHAWRQGMWHALRQATGTRSPNRFLVRDLPLVVHEIQRIAQVAQAFHEVVLEASMKTLKGAIRTVGNEPSVLESIERDFRAIGNTPAQVPLGLLDDLRSTLNAI